MASDAQRLAAIDFGSNAIRLIIGSIHCDASGYFLKREASYRVPLRLGGDVFSTGIIPEEKILHICEVFQAFSHLLNFFAPVALRACATSAMREASNGAQVVERVFQSTNIALEIISGQTEAELLFSSPSEDSAFKQTRISLYIDVGGGSTELTLMDHGLVLKSESFRVGTIRSLKGKVQESEVERMRTWIEQLPTGHKPEIAIGTGGNIGKILDLTNHDTDNPIITRKAIRELVEKLDAMSIDDRIRKVGLKPDRADVIVPAGKVYVQVMKWADTKEMIVPKVGVSDGILNVLFQSWKQKHTENGNL